VNLRIMEDHGDDRDFIAQQFALQDQNGNGSIDFEEFKVRRLRCAGLPVPEFSGRHRPSPFGIFATFGNLKTENLRGKTRIAGVFFPPFSPSRRSRDANRFRRPFCRSPLITPHPSTRRLSTTRASTTARA
jgi:hypothetical protein